MESAGLPRLASAPTTTNSAVGGPTPTANSARRYTGTAIKTARPALPRSAGANSPQRRSLPAAAYTQPVPTPAPATTPTVGVDPQAEQLWQALLGENEQLRLQIVMLQGKLVEKMRSHAKVLVGGGQFRGVAGALGKQPPTVGVPSSPTISACGGCVTLRATMKQLKDAQHSAIEAIKHQAETQLVKAQSAWESALRLREEDLSQRVVMERHHAAETATKQELLIESLRGELDSAKRALETLQGQRYEEKVAPTHRPKELVPTPTLQQSSTSTQCDDGSNRQLMLKDAALAEAERRLHQLSAAHQELFTSHRTLSADWERLQSHVKTIEQRHASEQRELEQRHADVSAAKDSHRQRVETELESLRRAISMKEAEQESIRRQLETAQLDTKRQLDATTDELQATRRQLDAVRASETQLTRCIEQLTSELHANQASVSNLERQLEMTINTNNQLTLSANEHVNEAATQTAQRERAELAASQLQHSLDDTQAKLVTIQRALDDTQRLYESAEARADAQDQLQRRLHAVHASALERALQSSVRLCVVAPTVNVHLAPTSTVTCKSPVPNQQLRHVVEHDVLPMFATVFVQPRESAGPQGVAMDSWLQTLLKDMQESLATHLHKLYNASTTG